MLKGPGPQRRKVNRTINFILHETFHVQNFHKSNSNSCEKKKIRKTESRWVKTDFPSDTWILQQNISRCSPWRLECTLRLRRLMLLKEISTASPAEFISGNYVGGFSWTVIRVQKEEPVAWREVLIGNHIKILRKARKTCALQAHKINNSANSITS